MALWYEHEKVFLKSPYTIDGWSLKMKIVMWCVLFGILTSSNCCAYFGSGYFNSFHSF